MEITAVNGSNATGDNFVISRQIEKELNSLKQAINKSSNSSKYMALVNDIERLYAQGNVLAAKRKLAEVENMAKKEGILDSNTPNGGQNTVTPNIPQPSVPTTGISVQNTLNNTQGTPDALQNTVTPNIPQPISPISNMDEQQIPGDNTQKTPAYGDKDTFSRDKMRTYQDDSGDIGASFKQPTPLTSMQARIAVPAHESGHVMRAVGDALVHKRKINYAYSVADWRVDYASHKFFLAGGEARIQTDGPVFSLENSKLDVVA
ncbi:MAG: hypothetical protein PHX21_03780 [bacterium]|nr:hypothetical protein [bacterium]